MKLKNHTKCHYVMTWSIYYINNIEGDVCDFVFNDKKSVFSYFVGYNYIKNI